MSLSFNKRASVEAVTLPQHIFEMLHDAWDATPAPMPPVRAGPAEYERREEHREARRLADRREVAGAKMTLARKKPIFAPNTLTRQEHLVEARLQIT
jgi:hypothetical protein